jgi:hypothetical protein
MTGFSMVTITLALVGVFATFWLLVEWTGGAAGTALSVCRSMQTGFDAWREAQDEAPPPAAGAPAQGPPPDEASDGRDRRFDPGFDVPMQVVRARPPGR